MVTTNATILPKDQVLTYERDVEDFRTFAIVAHADQRYGEYPYAVHLATVEQVLASHNYTEFNYRAAAWLHDVLEDTKVNLVFIVERWGGDVGEMVLGCTGEGPNRKVRNQSIYDKLNRMSMGAPVKVADRIANMKTGIAERNLKKLTMYLNEYREFSDAIRPIVTKDRRGALLWATLDQTATQALDLVRSFSVAKAA